MRIHAQGLVVAVTLLLAASPVAASPRANSAEALRKLRDLNGGVFIVAHRGCHNPAPSRGLFDPTPENSLQALERCIALGVDMVEVDVRRTKDGVLVILHDATVDRTTNGTGRLADMTAAEFKRLRLRQNFGGSMSPMLTDEAPSTLDEFLARAKGRMMLNLDIKEPIQAEVAAAVVKAGVADEMLIKADAGPEAPPMADQAPFNDLPFMPMLRSSPMGKATDVGAIVARQASASHRIPAVEMIFLRPEEFQAVRASARQAGVRLWNNVLTSVGVIGVVGYGGDLDALRTPDGIWGRQISEGISIFQTDEPAPLLDYIASRRFKSVGR